MVVAAIFHIVQNWSSLRNHFRDRRVFALLILVTLVIFFLAFGQMGQKEPGREINPREITHQLTQANTNNLVKAFGMDVNAVLALMRAKGHQVGSPDVTLQEVARQNQNSRNHSELLRPVAARSP